MSSWQSSEKSLGGSHRKSRRIWPQPSSRMMQIHWSKMSRSAFDLSELTLVLSCAVAQSPQVVVTLAPSQSLFCCTG